MENMWEDFFENVDWDEVERLANEVSPEEELRDYFWRESFDFKRSYIRSIMLAHPEITDKFTIDAASEQMYESHTEGVELSVDDALRFVKNDKPVPIEDLVKMLNDAGVNDGNILDVIEKGIKGMEELPLFSVENKGVRTKARLLTTMAEILAKNKDVLILGLPTFDQEQSWTQVKLAVFAENFTEEDKSLLMQLKHFSDSSKMYEEHGVAILVFRMNNIWAK